MIFFQLKCRREQWQKTQGTSDTCWDLQVPATTTTTTIIHQSRPPRVWNLKRSSHRCAMIERWQRIGVGWRQGILRIQKLKWWHVNRRIHHVDWEPRQSVAGGDRDELDHCGWYILRVCTVQETRYKTTRPMDPQKHVSLLVINYLNIPKHQRVRCLHKHSSRS